MHNASEKILNQLPESVDSIVVIASYRTGSTAFCNFLSKKYELLNFDEVFHCEQAKGILARRQKFFKYIESSSRTIIKIMPDQMPNEEVQKTIFSNAFTIGIYRKDIIAQTASLYIASITGLWHNNETTNYCVDIDIDNLTNQYTYIKKCNEEYQSLRPMCDIEVAYEDVSAHLAESSYRIYHKPLNYNEILMQVQNIAGNQ